MPSRKFVLLIDRQAREALSPAAYDWFVGQSLLTAEQVGEALGIGSPVPVVKRWRDQGKLIGVPVATGHAYPEFQFDRSRRRLRPEVVRLNLAATGSFWDQIERWAARFDDVETGRQDDQLLVIDR